MNDSLFQMVPIGSLLLAMLLHFVWQATVIIGLIAIFKGLIGPKWARLNYMISVAALLLIFAAPLITGGFYLANPEWLSVPNEPEFVAYAADSPEPLPEETTMLSAAGSLFQQIYFWCDRSRAIWLGIWGAGFCLLSLRLAFSLATCLRLRRGTETLPPELSKLANQLKSKMRISSRVLIASSQNVTQAIATGVIKPMVLIPASWLTELPMASLEAVIAHELAHVRRWDLWVNFLQRIAETVFFFHPMVWWLSRRIRQEREICCDQLAIRVTGKRMDYVETLAWAAQRKGCPNHSFQFGNAFLGEQKMSLLRRVRMILEPSQVDVHSPIRSLTVIACLAISSMFGSYAFSSNTSDRAADDGDQEKQDVIVIREHQDGDTDDPNVRVHRLHGDQGDYFVFADNEDDKQDKQRHRFQFIVTADDEGDIDTEDLARQLREIADKLAKGKKGDKQAKRNRFIRIANDTEPKQIRSEFRFSADPFDKSNNVRVRQRYIHRDDEGKPHEKSKSTYRMIERLDDSRQRVHRDHPNFRFFSDHHDDKAKAEAESHYRWQRKLDPAQNKEKQGRWEHRSRSGVYQVADVWKTREKQKDQPSPSDRHRGDHDDEMQKLISELKSQVGELRDELDQLRSQHKKSKDTPHGRFQYRDDTRHRVIQLRSIEEAINRDDKSKNQGVYRLEFKKGDHDGAKANYRWIRPKKESKDAPRGRFLHRDDDFKGVYEFRSIEAPKGKAVYWDDKDKKQGVYLLEFENSDQEGAPAKYRLIHPKKENTFKFQGNEFEFKNDFRFSDGRQWNELKAHPKSGGKMNVFVEFENKDDDKADAKKSKKRGRALYRIESKEKQDRAKPRKRDDNRKASSNVEASESEFEIL